MQINKLLKTMFHHIALANNPDNKEQLAQELKALENTDLNNAFILLLEFMTEEEYDVYSPAIDAYLDEFDRRDPLPPLPSIEESWSKLWAKFYASRLVDIPEPPPLP